MTLSRPSECRLSDKITQAEAELAKLDVALTDAQGADQRIAALNEDRMAIYERIFAAIVEEERQLSALYAPLQGRLQAQSGSLAKLSFSVRRQVDVARWAEAGESLLDLRKTGPFRFRGTLLSTAKAELEPAWRSSSGVCVCHMRSTCHWRASNRACSRNIRLGPFC